MSEGAHKSTRTPLPISIAVPTYHREEVLIDTVDCLLKLDPGAAEILLLDQTAKHAAPTEAALRQWSENDKVRWIQLAEPSITGAMNLALTRAREEVVLFLDDDIVPFPGLVAAHANAHRQGHRLVAGRVLQPWDGEFSSATWTEKKFASTESQEIEAFMGGNFSLRRRDALELGGFDENFVRVAYNFEREFADRWRARGGAIFFCPDATIRHLKTTSGGTRAFGEHLTTLSPAHSVGAYYYLLRSPLAGNRLREFVLRPVRSVMTRHHLRRPWWIPVTLFAELTGMLWALWLYARGPRLCVRPFEGGV